MNNLKNLLVWYAYNEDGEIDRLVRLSAVLADENLDRDFVKNFMSPPTNGGGIEKIVKEHIDVPEYLLGVNGVAFVFYAYGRRFRAALPYFVMITESD